MQQYRDEDITFYLVVYKDLERAVWCLENLRRTFPRARVVIDVDGDDDSRWGKLRKRFNAEISYGSRLFLLEHGGAIVKRMLQRHTADPQQRWWLFRIDTDTEIRRRFRWLPPSHYFGQLYAPSGLIQGGCIGITRQVCMRILQSKCLERSDIKQDPLIWQGAADIAEDRVNQHGLVSFDWLLYWAMQRNGVKGYNFEEVQSTWRVPIPATVNCAIAHPCKDIPVRRPI